MKRGLSLTLALVLIVLLLYQAGPQQKPRVAQVINTQWIQRDPQGYVSAQEQRFDDIRPGAHKEIIWADPETKQTTELAVVYIHGFTASKHEIRPVPDRVASGLGANLFYTRLAGHGRTGKALAQVHWQQWYDDVQEALAIGRALGDAVLVIGMSAGAVLLTAASDDIDAMKHVKGLVLISPVYAVPQFGLSLTAGPWGSTLTDLFIGKNRTIPAMNNEHAKRWTLTYPSQALVPLAVVMDQVDSFAPGDAIVPALFLYSPQDQVVVPRRVIETAEAWGAGSTIGQVTQSTDPKSHVIAGDIRSPETTDQVVTDILDWIAELPN